VGENTVIDLTADTVTAATLAEGVTAHGADGEVVTGTMVKTPENAVGFYPDEWDEDGAVVHGTLKGLSSIPAYMCANSGLSGYSVETGAGQYDCLKTVTLPDTITAVGLSAFRGCVSLQTVALPSSVTEILGTAFVNCNSLVLTELPSGLTQLGQSAFYSCKSLSSMRIPASIKSIENAAFAYSALASVIFYGSGTPQSISSIAFKGCNSLTDIYVPWSEGAVDNAPWGATNATIHYDTASE